MSLALSRVTSGRAGAPSGPSYVTRGALPGTDPVPGSELDLSGEAGTCNLGERSGSSLSLMKRGVWQKAEGASAVTKGLISETYVVENPDCRPGIIETSNGPLTKGYGDAALAGPEDVTVTVEGVERAVSYVEPTLGLIVLEQPIYAGSSVQVEYYYTPNPRLQFNEFNNFGYVFNQFKTDRASRFPYETVFGPEDPPQPEWNGFTFTAFDHNYTSTFNDPTTMLFNEPPHSLRLNPLERAITSSFLTFEGSASPTVDGWEVSGTEGALEFEENLFVIEDSSTSSDVIKSDGLYYRQEVDLTYEHATLLNFRSKVFSYTSDGDFTGVAAGYASEDRLFFLGMLEVGGFKFVGFLGNSGDETEWTSYHGLPSVRTPRSVSGSSLNDRLVFDFLPDLASGDRIFLEGAIYEVDSVTETVAGGQWDVILTTEMAGSGVANVFPEHDFQILGSYRIFKNEAGIARVYVGGNPAPLAYIEDTDLPYQEEAFELLTWNEFFFGSVSRRATNRTGWDFLRVSVLPTVSAETIGDQFFLDEEFTTLPELGTQDPWVVLDDQGTATILEDDYLAIQQGGRRDEGSFSYGRIEPLLTDQARMEFEASLRVDSFALDSVPASITLADNWKEVTLAFFASDEVPTFFTDYATFRVTGGHFDVEPYTLGTKGLVASVLNVGATTAVPNYSTSYSGAETFEDEGWTSTLGALTGGDFIDHFRRFDKPSGETGSALVSVPTTTSFENYVYAARLRINSSTLDGDSKVPLHFGIDDSGLVAHLALMTDGATNKVVFTDRSGAILADGLGDPLGAEFDWNDGEFHTYRLIRSFTSISLFIDGEFLVSVTDAQLDASTISGQVELAVDLESEAVSLDVDFIFSHSAQYGERRVGLFTGGDPYSISSYELVDAEFLGTFLDVRVFRDPAGKTQVFLNGDNTPAFVKQYSELPDRRVTAELNTELGFVRFGAMDPTSLSESVWDRIRYSIQNVREEQVALENSVFNYAWTSWSSEPVYDETLEEIVVPADSPTEVFLSSKGYFAERVLAVTSEDGATSYAFSFDRATNEITLSGSTLPEERENVFIRYLAREPYVVNYLEDQDPVVRLNERTPPFEANWEKVVSFVSELVSAYDDNATNHEGLDYTFSDGKVRVTYSVNDEAYYSSLALEEVDLGGETGLMTPACDDLGLIDLEFSEFSDSYTIPESQPDGIGGQDQPFLFDDIESTFDGDRVFEPLSEPLVDSEVEVTFVDIRSDAADEASDEALTGLGFSFITELSGFVFDNPTSTFDALEDELDDYAETEVPLDFTTSYP